MFDRKTVQTTETTHGFRNKQASDDFSICYVEGSPGVYDRTHMVKDVVTERHIKSLVFYGRARHEPGNAWV